jgi:hypothetical protein
MGQGHFGFFLKTAQEFKVVKKRKAKAKSSRLRMIQI